MNGNLLSAIWPKSKPLATGRIVFVLLGVLLLAVSARIQVPFWPVPMTLQVLAVLLIGATAGARLGGATVVAYLAAGASGLPVFAGGAGPAYMAGPTGGYLAGFLVAALLVGWLADRGFGRTILSALVLMLVGELAIFGLGLSWLSALIGLEKAIAGGLVPFIPAELLKMALGAAILAAAWKRAKG